MTNIPNYILCLFSIITIVLSYIVLTWILDITMVEGYTNPQYKYIPSSSPNLYIEFGISDLAVDVSSACGFIKVDSKLINPTPQPQVTEPVSDAESTQSDTSTRPPLPTTAPTPSVNSNNDYTVPYTQLQIYKMYNTASGYSSTSRTVM